MTKKKDTEIDINKAECLDIEVFFGEWEKKHTQKMVCKDNFEEMALVHGKIKRSLTNTRQILEACDVLGIDLISVGLKSQFIKQTLSWPFNHDNSLFTRDLRYGDPKDSFNSGCPAVWRVADLVSGINKSCGNSNQSQITGDKVLGVYLKRDGVWQYVDNY